MTDSELQQKRLIAALIDIAIAVGITVVFVIGSFAVVMIAGHSGGEGIGVMGYVGRILGFLGSVLNLGFVLGRDVLAGGNSIGKKTQGIRVVTTAGAGIGFVDSAKRNAFFAIGSLLGLVSSTLRLIPCLGDVVACLLTPLFWIGCVLSLVVAVIEVVKITQDPAGIRLGDNFAGTRVVR
jgi:uncharacterized RDD family membrane protein YckC